IDVSSKYGGNHGDIRLVDNPIATPPLEIVQQGKAAIRAYFRSLQGQETVRLNEVKLLLVGEGMAGKTSLLKRLQGLPFDAQESQTHGINVVTLPAASISGLEAHANLAECQLHCWDFGGQEIMHASHQFFLSQRALYILVIDSRTDDKKHHWLKHIEKFGGNSPLIVAMNKMDLNPGYNVEQNSLNRSFPNIKNRFVRLSCHTDAGLPDLINHIAAAIPETSLFGSPISVAWMNVKNQLEQETASKRYISQARFLAICQENNVHDRDSQQTLLQYLHDLGIVLYFKHLNLASIYVLDPHWVTIGVYKIINSEKVNEGRLRESDLDYILNEEQIKKKEYDPARQKSIRYSLDEQRYILSIMQQFELCYLYNERRREYIIPSQLPKEINGEPNLDTGTPLRFIMRYDYLPASIIPRTMIDFRNDIEPGQQWRFGMVLQNSSTQCRAKIKADEQKKSIEITVQGEAHRKREYFAIIRHTLRDISSEFENLEIGEWIPLPGHPNTLVEYQELLGYERAGRDEYFHGKLGQTFSVSQLLDSVVSPADRQRDSQLLNEALRDAKTVHIERYYEGGHHEGDTTQVGNITEATGIAVGRKSQASVGSSPPAAPPPANTPPPLTEAEQAELAALATHKQLLERPLHLWAWVAAVGYVLLYVGLLLLAWWLLNKLVAWQSWNTLEPYTWIVSVVMALAAPLLVWLVPDRLSPYALRDWLFAWLQRRSFEKHGFKLERYEVLRARA
ncbi:MAG: GTP-binding protein, partial [Anaerolineales bacterium]|nr:GTP-binding protein [Anaerolineales bacterium]